MQLLIYTLIVVVYTFDFLSLQLGLPRILLLAPEALAALAFVLILSELSKRGRLNIGPGYVLGFAIGILVIIAGLIIAEATTGPLVAGLRVYGKYFIFFLLPIACLPSEGQLRKQMWLLLAMGLIQLPVTLSQRFYFYAGGHGDAARGTVGTGAFNAIVLISITAVIVAAYCKKKISAGVATLLSAALLLPPAIADVKTAFFLMPLAILIPILNAKKESGDQRPPIAAGVLAAILALGSFVVIIDATENASYRLSDTSGQPNQSILDLLTDTDKLIAYAAPQTSGMDTARYGRVDGLLAPIVELRHEPMLLLTGLGLGAVTVSPFSQISSDQYLELRKSGKAKSTYSRIMWETGLLGAALFLAGFGLLWRDARLIRKESSLFGALGLGMTAIVPIVLVAFFWRDILDNNTIMCLLAYFAGLVAAKAAYLRQYPPINRSEYTLPDNDKPVVGSQIPGILQEPKADA